MTPQARFNEFLRDIEPSATTKSAAASGHAGVRDLLRTHPDFRDVHVNTFLSGSYARNTSIRPQVVAGVTQRPDVDIIVVTNHQLTDAPEDVVELLYQCLKDDYPDIRRQNRSVGITTSTVDMDVVPIISPFSSPELYYIPDRRLKTWLETNPPKHTTWTTEVNKKASNRFKPLIKLVKWWRRENPTIARKPKGFVLGCFAAECMDYEEAHYGRLFMLTLEGIVSRYNEWSVPWVADPGVASNSVTNGMTIHAWQGFYKKVKADAKVARDALEEEDPDRATSLWRKLFGSRFPAEPVGSTKSLLQAAVSSSLTFPNAPIQPRRPSGFA